MKLVKLFIAFVVISLIVGIGLAFNGGKKNVAPPNQSQNENQTNIDDKSISPTIETDLSSPEEMTSENVVTETATIPEELSGSNNVIQSSPENHEQKSII